MKLSQQGYWNTSFKWFCQLTQCFRVYQYCLWCIQVILDLWPHMMTEIRVHFALCDGLLHQTITWTSVDLLPVWSFSWDKVHRKYPSFLFCKLQRVCIFYGIYSTYPLGNPIRVKDIHHMTYNLVCLFIDLTTSVSIVHCVWWCWQIARVKKNRAHTLSFSITVLVQWIVLEFYHFKEEYTDCLKHISIHIAINSAFECNSDLPPNLWYKQHLCWQ